MESPFRQSRFQRPCSIEQRALMHASEARAALQGRVAKRGEQQPMGREGPPLLSFRPVAGDRRLDGFDQLLQTRLLPQTVHQIGGTALAVAVGDPMDGPSKGGQWSRAAISRAGHRGHWQRG